MTLSEKMEAIKRGELKFSDLTAEEIYTILISLIIYKALEEYYNL